MRHLLLILLLLGFSSSSRAQLSLNWTLVTTLDLPESIEVFEANEPLPINFRGVVVRADPRDPSWVWATSFLASGQTVGSHATASGETLVAINGGYFGGGQSYSLVASDGTVLASNIAQVTRDGLSFFPTRGAFGLSSSGVPDVAWIYNVAGTQYRYPMPSPNAPLLPQPRPDASFPAGGSPWDLFAGIGGGPILIQNGQIQITWTEEVFFGGSGVDTTSLRARTAIGYDADGKVLLFATRENRGATLREVAGILQEFGAVEAMNLDGGGSTALWAGGDYLIPSARPVVSAVVLRRPKHFDRVIVDTGTPGRYSESGTWFESANTPYFGSTPSRLNEVGIGEDRAVFRFPSQTQLDASGRNRSGGCMTLFAWWVAAPNRSTSTPITIYEQGSPVTVMVDQTRPENGGTWTPLANVTWADSVVVTDAAPSGGGTTYVNVDAVSLQGNACPAIEPSGIDAIDIAIFPNPTSGSADVVFETRQAGETSVRVLDALGRTLHESRRVLAPGHQRIAVPTQLFPPGRYLIHLTTPGGATTRPLTILR